MNRVLVIGCPGSGKSVLSRKLAQTTGLPLIHLDSLYHREGWPDDPEQKRRQWRELVASLTPGERWIIDGNYKGSFDIRFPAADTIVFLDYPRWLTLIRMVHRRITYHRKQRPDMPENWKEKISPDFLGFVWTYRTRERQRVLALLEQHRSERDIVVLQSPAEADEWLSRWADRHREVVNG